MRTLWLSSPAGDGIALSAGKWAEPADRHARQRTTPCAPWRPVNDTPSRDQALRVAGGPGPWLLVRGVDPIRHGQVRLGSCDRDRRSERKAPHLARKDCG